MCIRDSDKGGRKCPKKDPLKAYLKPFSALETLKPKPQRIQPRLFPHPTRCPLKHPKPKPTLYPQPRLTKTVKRAESSLRMAGRTWIFSKLLSKSGERLYRVT